MNPIYFKLTAVVESNLVPLLIFHLSTREDEKFFLPNTIFIPNSPLEYLALLSEPTANNTPY